jgi:colanic acid/amylovoran biosynthesis glycosyltransferase
MHRKSSVLRIVIVGIRWPPETFLANLILRLAERGIKITLALGGRRRSGWLTHPNINWIHTPNWTGSYVGRLIQLVLSFVIALMRSPKDVKYFLSYAGQYNRIVNKFRELNKLLPFAGRTWDVIYFPWNSAAMRYQALYGLGMPVVLSCRGSQINIAPHNPRRSIYRNALEDTFRAATIVHCVSESILQEAMRYGLNPEKACVIRPAVDPKFFYPAKKRTYSKKSFEIVSVGNLNWVKGYEYAIQTIRYLKDLGVPVRYHIIGDGPERIRIQYTVLDLGLREDVILHGHVDHHTVCKRLQNSDVFLLSSVSEGISNAALEAMACGLPVVTSNCGGMRELVANGVEGFVVPIREPLIMAKMLYSLWTNEYIRRRMQQASRERILHEFTLDLQIDNFIRLFNSV